MERGRRFGGHSYSVLGVLPSCGAEPGCTFSVVRREGDGSRSLLQLWEPRPTDRVLDTLRAEFLQRHSDAEPLDPGACHLGFDDEKVWCLQELNGTPLLRLWGEADARGRLELEGKLSSELGRSKGVRLLCPEVIGIKPGRVLAPRVLGVPQEGLSCLFKRLEEAELPLPAVAGPRPWADPPDLADGFRTPVRGRNLELTYLKSLMFGMCAPTPMERVVLLLGEPGLGHERLCDWATAAAETEGLWVSSLDARADETAGSFLERLVQDLISGLEADLYATMPGVARALSRRMATFAFLHGGHRAGSAERKLEPPEVDAALEALAFAQACHPRLIQLRGLERAVPEVHDLVKELVLGSRLPWMLSSRGAVARSCTTSLKHHPEAAIMVLDRLDDAQIALVLGDLLGAHDLPEPVVRQLCSACLGNPGLMQRFLEMAQMKGSLVNKGGRWTHPEGVPLKVVMQEELVQEILAGRLLRLNPASLALVRFLALADLPLGRTTLGRVMGLDGDGVEEALRAAASAKLALAGEAGGSIASIQVRDLAIAKMPPHEGVRCARLLLKVLEEEGGKPVLSVRLQSFAMDPATALTQVLQAIKEELPGPQAALRIVEEALKLAPSPRQEARLLEFLSDNLCLATEGDRLSLTGFEGRSPYELALEALNRSIEALGEVSASGEVEEQGARLHRKKALLEMRLRRFQAAAQSLGEARRLLADHPFHAEQPRLCLALGRHHLLLGEGDKGLRRLEEGLQLLTQKGTGDHKDQVALLFELGKAQGQRAFFQTALDSMQSVKRIFEHSGDRRGLAAVLARLGLVYLGMGQTDSAGECVREAMAQAQLLDDVALLASCHFQMGVLRSIQQQLGPALTHLDRAILDYSALGDKALATQAQVWKARTLAASGDGVLAELVLLQASAIPVEVLTPEERGDRALLEGDIAGFKQDWEEAARQYQAAANRFAESGLLWRERRARLLWIQAQAKGPEGPAGLRSAWNRLEALKGPVESSGSRWLDAEWHLAHALVLSLSGQDEAVIADALHAWGQVLTFARELRFPALALEASTQSSRLLMARGERFGARTLAQDALAAFQEIWSRLPETFEKGFLERADVQRMKTVAAQAGLPFHLPDHADPLADWSPTQVNLPAVPSLRVSQ